MTSASAAETLQHRAKPVFRNPDKVQVLEWREWLRENMPNGSEGFVAEDLDLVVLRFGALEGRDKNADGRFMLIELKQNRKSMQYAQQRVFGLIHRLLRAGDPGGRHYIGFYLVHWGEEFVRVNGETLGEEEFKSWLLGQSELPSMFE